MGRRKRRLVTKRAQERRMMENTNPTLTSENSVAQQKLVEPAVVPEVTNLITEPVLETQKTTTTVSTTTTETEMNPFPTETPTIIKKTPTKTTVNKTTRKTTVKKTTAKKPTTRRKKTNNSSK